MPSFLPLPPEPDLVCLAAGGVALLGLGACCASMQVLAPGVAANRLAATCAELSVFWDFLARAFFSVSSRSSLDQALSKVSNTGVLRASRLEKMPSKGASAGRVLCCSFKTFSLHSADRAASIKQPVKRL